VDELEPLLRGILAARAPEGVAARIVAVDGPGGAGKSTLAAALARGLGGAPIVATDDFASWDEPLDWWPRLLEEVLRPLAAGAPVRYRVYDWERRRLGRQVELAPAPDVVVLEGVSAMRREFAPFLAYRIWVETPRDERLRRGIERDGAGMREQWLRWMAEEDAYVARDDPRSRADAIVPGVT
jgi:uridine kinase